jgi:hypothetical protein
MAWSVLILLQPMLAGIFLYFYLRHLKLLPVASFLGAISFAFCGFIVAWLEWNTLAQVILWLPLMLLAIDQLLKSYSLKWAVILVFAGVSAVFAGHLQTLGYVVIFASIYFIVRLGNSVRWQIAVMVKPLLFFLMLSIIILGLTSVQLIPTLKFISGSARSFDLPDWHRSDWFLPPMQLAQFLAPDFFGNPATNNYWGTWNYGEFVGYIGLVGLFFGVYAMFWRRDKKTAFFASAGICALLFALPTPIAKLPYIWQLPFISTLQPSRILVIAEISLAILAGLGFDLFLKSKAQLKKTIIALIPLIVCMLVLWLRIFYAKGIAVADLTTAKRNLLLPTLTLVSIVLLAPLLNVKNLKLRNLSLTLLLILTVFDLGRFMTKYTSFTEPRYLYPKTATLTFLQQNIGFNRVLTTDRKILPPNIGSFYKIASVDGYDPVYLSRYGELVAAWTRNKPDITPAAFNRILTPQNPDSIFTDFLGVKYILTFSSLTNPKLHPVFSEGLTKMYENMSAAPRAFLVWEVMGGLHKQEIIENLFSQAKSFTKKVFLENKTQVDTLPLGLDESVTIKEYSSSHMLLTVRASITRFLVVTDIYYPSTRGFIDGVTAPILAADYFFTGLIVPAGIHQIELVW